MKLLFDDENSRCLEVDSPLQTLSFFLFSSKLSSEYKRIFVGPFFQCEFIFSGFLGLPDEFRQNSTLERRGCESSLTGGDANSSTFHHLGHEEAGRHGDLEAPREEQGEEAPLKISSF